MAKRCMLTTCDNPYDPFTQYECWFKYDVMSGHDSCSLLARFAQTSDTLSDQENDLEIERAINEIIKYDPLNIYKKVSIETPDT